MSMIQILHSFKNDIKWMKHALSKYLYNYVYKYRVSLLAVNMWVFFVVERRMWWHVNDIIIMHVCILRNVFLNWTPCTYNQQSSISAISCFSFDSHSIEFHIEFEHIISSNINFMFELCNQSAADAWARKKKIYFFFNFKN